MIFLVKGLRGDNENIRPERPVHLEFHYSTGYIPPVSFKISLHRQVMCNNGITVSIASVSTHTLIMWCACFIQDPFGKKGFDYVGKFGKTGQGILAKYL